MLGVNKGEIAARWAQTPVDWSRRDTVKVPSNLLLGQRFLKAASPGRRSIIGCVGLAGLEAKM
jgi:hypothetical protein